MLLRRRAARSLAAATIAPRHLTPALEVRYAFTARLQGTARTHTEAPVNDYEVSWLLSTLTGLNTSNEPLPRKRIGHHQSSREAGASAKLAKQVGDAAVYAARIETPKTPGAPYAWTAEWRIPFAALGIKPRPGLELPFNLSVRRTAEDCWVTWAKMPGMHTWCIGPENVIRIAGSK